MPRGAPLPGPNAYKSTQRVVAPDRYARRWIGGGVYPGTTDATPEPSAPTATGRSPTHPYGLGAYTWGLVGLGYRNAAFAKLAGPAAQPLKKGFPRLSGPREVCCNGFAPKPHQERQGWGYCPPGCCTLMGVAWFRR